MDSSVGQLELALLRAFLHSFERRFYQTVGPSYVDLDEAYALAAKARARMVPAWRRLALDAQEKATQSAEQCAHAMLRPAADSLLSAQPLSLKTETLKQLHHNLARYFHPDLASDHARQVVREKLMTEVNLAFQAEDLRHLELLAGALDRDENGDAARQLAALAVTPINELRERTAYASRHHHDLLRELADYVHRQAAAVRQRGPAVQTPEANEASLVERALHDLTAVEAPRRLRFPADQSMGVLTMRAERDIDARPVTLGEARGIVTAPFGKALCLRLNSACDDLSPLLHLDPEDLNGVIDEWPDFVNLSDHRVQPLAHFSSLEVLNLGRTDITGRVFDQFPSLHELRVLLLEETQFDDAGLLRLEECVWMQQLDISFTQVTGPGLKAIYNMTALRELSLYGTVVADADLAGITHIPGLRNLNLGLTAITDGAAEYLRQLRSLEVLNLGGTAITDSLLDTLSELRGLRELMLWETAITEAGLDKLRSFAALRYLDVDQTKVGREALAAFRVARPEVRLPSDIWAEGA